MKTRRKREQLEIRKRRMRLLETRLRVAAFHNPYKSYKIGQVISRSIQNLFFDEVDGEPRVTLPTFFKWNRISSAVNHADRIVFSLTAINQQNMISERYVIDRFKSYGRKDLNEFAVKLEQLLQNGSYTKEECELFPQAQQLLKKCEMPNWLSLHGDFSQGSPCFRTMEVSHAFCRKFNMTPEQMMVQCVRYGDLPIKSTVLSLQVYTELCLNLINLMLMYRTMAKQHNEATIRQLGQLGKTVQDIVYVTSNNVTGKARYQMSFPSPNIILFLVDRIEEQFFVPLQWQSQHNELVNIEEYEAMKLVTKYFNGLKPPNGYAQVCKYRLRNQQPEPYRLEPPTKGEAKREEEQN